MKYRHLIWDWNGTLFDDVDLCIGINNRILKKNNLEQITHEQYLKLFCFPLEDYYKKIGIDGEKFASISGDFILDYESKKNDCSLYSGAREVLAYISKLGISQSLLSAYKQEPLLKLTKKLGIQNAFVQIRGVDNHHARGKEDMTRRMLEDHHLKPEEVLFVGDTLHDRGIAEAIGSDILLLTHGHMSKKRLAENNGVVIDSYDDIVDKLEL